VMRGWLVREWRFFWSAVTVLTRLRTPRLAGFEPAWLACAPAYFPLVGLVVGLLSAAAWRCAAALWPAAVASLLALAAAAWLTGGLHEDGWTDLFDGLAASGERERVLEVMKDSRVGAVGALALFLLLGGKLAALVALPAARVPGALVASHVLSRWSMLPLLWRLPYARPAGGVAQALAGRATGARLAAGTAAAVLIAVLALGWGALPAALAAAAATGAAGLYLRARLGGYTGDCLGAVTQLTELCVLMVLAARCPVAAP
jgi:adenosylcobinamide-GDP ribazoletransferase